MQFTSHCNRSVVVVVVVAIYSKISLHPHYLGFTSNAQCSIDVAATLEYGSVYLNFIGLRHLLLMCLTCVYEFL